MTAPERIWQLHDVEPYQATPDGPWANTRSIEYVRKDIYDTVVEKGREAALCVISADGQAQDALDRALKAEAEVARLREALKLYSCHEGCNDCAEHERDRVSCGWTARAVLQTESLAADDNHL